MRPPTATILCAVLATTSCTLQPAPRYARPALSFDAAAVERPVLVECTQHGDGHLTGVLQGGGERVVFDLQSGPDDGGPGRPLVLVVPILAGGRELTGMVARRMQAHGFDVAFCERAGAAMRAPQRGPDLEELFRRTILHQRLLLAWLRDRERPPTHVHVLGLSMGGMITAVLAAQEPGIDGVAICLSGADLPDLVVRSSEDRVARWREWRYATDGIGVDSLRWELQQFLDHEPLRFAPAVATEKVLFVSAAFDTVVPRRNQRLLWESLGRPQRLDLPLGHYTAALAIDRVLSAAAEHFRIRQTPPAVRATEPGRTAELPRRLHVARPPRLMFTPHSPVSDLRPCISRSHSARR